MAKEGHRINLLPNNGDGLLDQFFTWALTVGRLLVIITETLALSVFIYRFSLDMRIVDLHDQIRAESSIVQNFKNSEEIFRNLQNRLALIKTYDTTSVKTLPIMKDILAMGQGKVTFINLLITTNSVQMTIQTPSTTNLAPFIQALKTYPAISSVSINQVENKTANATITVSILATIKETEIE